MQQIDQENDIRKKNSIHINIFTNKRTTANIDSALMQTKVQNYHQSQSHFQPSTPSQSQNEFTRTYGQIRQQLSLRNTLIKSLSDPQHNAQHLLSASKKQHILANCSQYSKMGPLISSIINNSLHNSGHLNHQNFWQSNEGLQRQLEQELRDLKTLDNVIDNIVNEEFDKCNEIDEIDETIRLILSKKDQGHIAKAQPYYHQKQLCLDSLNEKKDEKEKIKTEKYNQVRKILNLLDQLKRHREAGLKASLAEGKDKKLGEAEQTLLERAISDIKQMQKNENYLSSLESQTKDLTSFISDMQRRIEDYGKELLNFIDQQNEACLQLQEIVRLKAETEYFQTSIFSIFGISNLRKVPKKDFVPSLQDAVMKLQQYSKESRQKQRQAMKIQQGILTTRRTIEIFEHILQKIKTENSRKKLLLVEIEKIQQKHEQQQKILISISENENEFEKLKLNRNQLNKNLDNKMNEANVAAYKNIHDEIQKIETEIKLKGKKVEALKLVASENARKLYDQTMGLQQQYEDILSEIVPSLWLKGSDFTKEEAIKDLNLYLLKTFKRLSIAD